ncbi:IS3 family transposase [Rhodococcus sp. P1Y]|uniref:IS3 family transposase n=1 Tax=Rhodococcus sp. P1Y TaxID=1302308 RepID=UPI00137AE8A7
MHPLHGFRRHWAHLRRDKGMTVNPKKVNRLRKEERLQVRISLSPGQTRRCQLVPADRSRCTEGVVGYGFSARLDRRGEGN